MARQTVLVPGMPKCGSRGPESFSALGGGSNRAGRFSTRCLWGGRYLDCVGGVRTERGFFVGHCDWWKKIEGGFFRQQNRVLKPEVPEGPSQGKKMVNDMCPRPGSEYMVFLAYAMSCYMGECKGPHHCLHVGRALFFAAPSQAQSFIAGGSCPVTSAARSRRWLVRPSII